MVRVLEGISTNLYKPGVLNNGVLEIWLRSQYNITVEGGSFGRAVIADTSVARIGPSSLGFVPTGDSVLLTDDVVGITIYSGAALGRTTITITSDGPPVSLEVVVVDQTIGPPAYVPGVDHAHTPAGRWADVQANPNNGAGLIGWGLEQLCAVSTPLQLVNTAKSMQFKDKPIALKHLNWYLTDGHGADFVEDDNIADWLKRDSGIKSRLKRAILPGRIPRGHFEFLQPEYALEDFQYAFGSIDRVDFQVDFRRDAVRVWFQDRYEWHPVYPFYTLKPGDAPPRETNCLHAAFVELKSTGAADFWMKGSADVNLSSL